MEEVKNNVKVKEELKFKYLVQSLFDLYKNSTKRRKIAWDIRN